MNDLSIILPCGFSVKYKDFFFKINKFQCPACKTHEITRQECLNIARNKLVVIEKSLELQTNNYDKLMKKLEKYKNDPRYYIDESYDSLKREVDVRREEIKLMLNKKIDDFHDELLEKIDAERDLKLKELEKKIQKAQSFDKASFKIDENLDIHSKLEFYRKSKIEIDNGISLVQNIIDDFKEPTFKLTDGCDEIDTKKIFGEFYLRENTKIIFDNLEIDDDNRTEATFQFIINNFSRLKDRKNFILYSKKCIVRNLEWYIQIRLNEKDGEMAFYLCCNSMKESNNFLVNVTTELTLLNKSDSKKNFSLKYEQLFTQTDLSWGYSKFTTMKKIMNPANGFHDAIDDSITLKVVLNAKSE
ncbi:ubiquitin carboxyl-terminal hydrolase 7 isoform X1 [Brachionus plicatilis]|uniref:Ubiquitin carboxyl-terminal hydrolase 7 isoform X1 n=1 Tax=Brachionus plicatilis TaxID=10195 RepID=A0A3M7QUN9_BRAPC|nr:ubiquitin carboxyl-terminal hydrolase 7 isoform X1 [Brachionus plicatilis]